MDKYKEEFRTINLSKITKNIGVIMLALIAILTLALLFMGLVDEHPQHVTWLDNLLSILFLLLFVFMFWLSNDKKVFVKRNWWLLLGALPLIFVQGDEGILLWVSNLLAVSRFVVRFSLLVRISRRLVPRTYTLILVTSLTSIVLISTALFYAAEHSVNPDVNTYFDSFWWTIVSGTTVGYGDITPVTTNGRIVGIFMMILGIGVFGFVTGSVASMLSNRAKRLSENKEDK